MCDGQGDHKLVSRQFDKMERFGDRGGEKYSKATTISKEKEKSEKKETTIQAWLKQRITEKERKRESLENILKETLDRRML